MSGAFGLLLLRLNSWQIGFGKREDQRDRLELRDNDEAIWRRRADDVADIDLADADDAVDRRGQPRVAQLHVRGVDERLVGLDRALELRDLRLLRVQELRCGEALLFQRCVTVEIGLCVGELGLVAIAVRGELFDLRLIGTRIDLRQQIAGMDLLSFGEVDAGDLALDLGAHHDRVVGDHRPDAVQIDRHVMLGDRPGDDRSGRRRGARRLSVSRRPQMSERKCATGDDDDCDADENEVLPSHGELPCL